MSSISPWIGSMHILYLCNEYPPGRGGGIGTFTRTLARQMVGAGCTVTVLGQQRIPKETIEDDQGVTVIRMPAVYTPGVNAFVNADNLRRRIHQIHRQTPVDIIDGPELSFWGLSGKIPRVKVIRIQGGHHFFSVTLGERPKLFRGIVEKISFKHADHYCAVSQFAAEETRRLVHLENAPIYILPNPVDTQLFSPRPTITELPGRIYFAGAIREKKGIRQLVEAMPQIVAQIPEAHLVAAGKDTIDPRTGKSYIAGLQENMPDNVRNKISFLGPVKHENLPDLMAAAQVCVFPSHMETQGIVIIEGMAMSKLVVASRTGPGPEIIQHEENGLLCDPFDPSSIANEVTRALRESDLRQRLGSAARKTVEEKYAIDVMLQKNLDFYHDCLEHRA